MCNIIKTMPYNGCSQMVSISLKTKKSFIAHPWCLLSVVGLEEYSVHNWRPATSVQPAPVTWCEWGLWTEQMFCHKSSTNISIDIWYYNRFIQLRRPISPVKHNGVSLFTILTTFGIAHARVRMLHSRGTGSSICDLSQIIATRRVNAFTAPSSHYISNNRIYVRSHLFVGTDSCLQSI